MASHVEPVDLKTLLDIIIGKGSKGSRKDTADKRRQSHALANGLIQIILARGAKLLEAGPGNANYFCAEIEGIHVAVSPFASHDGWWDKPSDGFRSLVERRGCRWGIALFTLPSKEGIWFEGKDYDLYVLRGRETVHKSYVTGAKRFGRTFSNDEKFLDLLKYGIEKRPKRVLIPKTGKR